MGLWIVFEGADGVGKTTLITEVAAKLKQDPFFRSLGSAIITTRHPGATPLGKHIRYLTKHPGEFDACIKIDPMAMQMLMAVDHLDFKTKILLPSLDNDIIILSDRCNLVSGLVYGLTTGMTYSQVNHLLDLTCNPRIDRLFILTCPPETVSDRKKLRNEKSDSFESRGNDFQNKISDFYATILFGPPEQTIILNRIVALENIEFINTDRDKERIVETIVHSIKVYLTANLTSK